MRRPILLILAAAVAAILAACGGAMERNANAGNVNAGKPAAPTKMALIELEGKAFDAFKNKDWKFFEGFLADNFVGFNSRGERTDKAGALKEMSEMNCTVKRHEFSDEQMMLAGADVAVLTLKAMQIFECDGKPGPLNSWSATVFVRSGDTWKAVYHNEIPVMDPAAAPAPPAKPEPGKPAPVKPAPPKPDAKPAAETTPADATTEALLAVVKKGWDAWKNRDAAAFEPIIAKDFVLVDPSGQRFDRAGAIKSWTEPKCTIKSYTLTDASGISLSKDTGLLTLKGAADGSCEGIGPLATIWGTYLLVKDGDAWKATLIFETPAK